MTENKRNPYYERRLKYLYLRFIRLKGEPHELALGMALGVFSGMMPVMPFQIALAVALALFLRASKITAALGTWASNPLNWVLIYLSDYKLGAYLLGIEGGIEKIKDVMYSINHGEEMAVIWGKLFSSGVTLVSALLIGGIILGTIAAVPTYFLFLRIFWRLRLWRQKRKAKKAAKSIHRQINASDE
ncbi:DUF2062 domain-containing protein [Thermodesulfobacteriota bacterium]